MGTTLLVLYGCFLPAHVNVPFVCIQLAKNENQITDGNGFHGPIVLPRPFITYFIIIYHIFVISH